MNVIKTILKWSRLVGLGWLLMGVAASAGAQDALPEVQNYAGVSYLTGGFGLEESTAIKDAMPDYSLVLTFASSDGAKAAYLSQVQVVVRDMHDTTMLNTESRGPFLLAQLPEGRYQVFATYRNKTRSQTVQVSDGQSTRVVFDWPRPAPTSAPEDQAKEDKENDSSDQADDDDDWKFPAGSIPGVH